DLRAVDRRRPRRSLPDTAAPGGGAVHGGRRRRGADPARGRGSAVPARGRGRHGRGSGDSHRATTGAGRRADALRRRAGRSRRGGDARMKVARDVSDLEPAPRAVAIGTFDGVHRGHRSVIEAAIAAGRRSTVVTFDPHPRRVLGYAVEQLTTLERRLELLAEAGVEETLVIEFTLEIQRIEAEDFADRYLRTMSTEVVFAGEDFRFGHRRRGDLALL